MLYQPFCVAPVAKKAKTADEAESSSEDEESDDDEEEEEEKPKKDTKAGNKRSANGVVTPPATPSKKIKANDGSAAPAPAASGESHPLAPPPRTDW